MLKGLVFDKDGSLYSASNYIAPFAAHLSRHFDSKEFLKKYHSFKERAIIGKKYNIHALCEQEDGKLLRSAFWVPALVALHYGFSGSFQEEFQSFSQFILNDSSFPFDSKLVEILSDSSYKKAIVSNEDSDKLLKKIRVYDLFDLKYLGAKKDQNLADICGNIESSFSANPSEIMWVEDDLEVLNRLKERGYITVLRKTKGFNYIPKEELKIIANLILEDDLTKLYNLIKQNGK